MSVHALADADAACGGKAVGLARLLRAGLPVPDGFVLDDRAFRHVVGVIDLRDEHALGHVLAAAADRIATAELPGALEREVRARAATLGVLAVRSSATIEDGDAGAAAGVFSSRRAVPATEVWAAIRAVWTSALTPLAAAYARRRGGSIAIGVIVQRFIDGPTATVYTRPPGAPADDRVVVQRGAGVEWRSRAERDPIVALALRAEAALGATHGVDVELVDPRPAAAWIVQARPIVHPVARPHTPPPPSVLAPLVADGRRWIWDIAHNPDPLSPAQADLVARVEQAAIGPWSLRVCAGFLYAAPRSDAAAPPSPGPARADAGDGGGAGAVLARAAERIEQRLAAILGEDAPELDEAIARYLRFYRIWADELGPLIARARGPRPSLRPSSIERLLAAAARGEVDEAAVLAQLGPMAPAWDIAVATYGERPALVRDAIARAAAVPVREAAQVPTVEELAADLAERDDVWFARAQWMVRRALLARAAQRAIAAEDAGWLTFEELATLAPDDAHRRASAAAAAAERAARWAMPLIVGGEPLPDRPPLHGVGTGAQISGRVVRFTSLASAVAVRTGDIVVTRAVTPALAVLVVGCAALVSETGGLLDHGAALARELGIPCVVGCHDAWSRLADGMLVTVDGDAGTVTPTGIVEETGTATRT